MSYRTSGVELADSVVDGDGIAAVVGELEGRIYCDDVAVNCSDGYSFVLCTRTKTRSDDYDIVDCPSISIFDCYLSISCEC